MFTIPVGNFVRDFVVKRPTSNVVTTNDLGTVTDPASAYDGSLSTYATVFSGFNPEGSSYDSYANVVYSSFPSFTVLDAKLYIVVEGTGDGNSIMVSYDNGANYIYNLPISTKYMGGVWTTQYQTANVPISNGVVSTQIKVKIASLPGTGTSSTLKVYDLYIEQ